MNSLGTSTIILLAEVNVLFLVAAAIVTAIHVSRRQRDHEALNRLAAKLKDDYPAHLDAAREHARTGGNRAEDEVERTAQHLVQKEYALYKRFMDIYAGRDSAGVQELDTAVSEVITGYRELPGGGTGGQGGAADTEETQHLRSENEQLKDELERTRQDRDSTLTEYASAFGAEDAPAADDEVDTPPETTAAAGGGEAHMNAAGMSDTPGEPEVGEPEVEAPGVEEPAAEQPGTGTEESDYGNAMPDGDDFDDALESLNLDEIDLGLDEPNRGTG